MTRLDKAAKKYDKSCDAERRAWQAWNQAQTKRRQADKDYSLACTEATPEEREAHAREA